MTTKKPEQKEEWEENQKITEQKNKEILKKVDADEMNQRLSDPKQSTPNARSDLGSIKE